MAEQIHRGPVENLPLRKKSRQPAQTVDTFVEGQAPSQGDSRAARVVKGVFEFSGKALDFAAQNEKKKIDLDKVTQQQRALQGLDPTDDATKGGIRAYQVVKMRDQVLETNADLSQRLRDNPDMSDEEYEIATREAYAPLLEQYQPDPQLSQALSNKLQESQTQIHQIRSAVQREHREWQKQEAFSTSIEEYREASGSPEELAGLIADGQLKNEADALGISEEQYRTGLVKFAEMDAASGDGRLLQALEGQEWASRDPRVDKARETYQQWASREYAVEIGTQWGEIQQGWKNRTASWAQTEESIRRINEKFPGAISSNQVASLRQQAAAQHSADAEKAEFMSAFYESMSSDDPVHLGTNPLIPDDMKDHAISKTNEIIDTQARQMQGTGEMKPEEAEAWAMEQKLKFGREQGVEMPGIKPIIESLAGTDPSDWEGEGIPNNFLPALRAIPMMNESDIRMYGKTETERNMMRTYQRFLSSDSPDRDAWARSYRSITAETSMSSESRSEMTEATRESIDDKLDRGLVQKLRGVEEVSDNLRPYLREEAVRYSYSVMGSGGTNSEIASDAGADYALSRVTVLDNGSFVTSNTQELIRNASFKDAEGNEYQLKERDITPAFDHFFQTRKDEFARESFHGEDLEIGNVRFEATRSGLINVLDDMGEPLTNGPINVRDITKEYLDYAAEQRASRAASRAQVEFEQLPPAERFGPGAVRE